MKHGVVGGHSWHNVVLDLLLLPLATIAAYLVRFEGWHWGPYETRIGITYVAVALPLKIGVFLVFGLYRRLWRYASVADLERIVAACATSGLLSLIVGATVLPTLGLTDRRVPLAVLMIDAMFSVAAVALPRLLSRILSRRRRTARGVGERRALIVGAGAAGGLIVQEMQESPQLGMRAVGILDDDKAKHRLRMHGVPVLGGLDKLERVVDEKDVDEIVIAMPTATGKVVRSVVRAAHAAGVPTRTVPGLFEIISGRKSVSALRQVQIEDLLRREPIATEPEGLRELATGETVLVTGAGGSIGSELCRQLARLEPAKVVALGRGENSIFEFMHEFTREFPRVRIEPVVADVRDSGRMKQVFERHRPYSVFHAAAHKHVPLMEQNVSEAVINNILGSRNVVSLAAEVESEHFVLVSTDKAVRPTSIMGASKRIAETVVHDVAEQCGRRFVSVRFGNVLGSRGSVVPTFLRQIAAGGPVMVTHPEMRRYFMTIPEAVQLVLQAGALGEGGEVFVLDMGEPVKIVDLASDLIRLSGLEVGTDVEIQFSGARPGEKLYEELFFSMENATPTRHPKVLKAKDVVWCDSQRGQVDELIVAAQRNAPTETLREMIRELVPEYMGAAATSGRDDTPPDVTAAYSASGDRPTYRS